MSAHNTSQGPVQSHQKGFQNRVEHVILYTYLGQVLLNDHFQILIAISGEFKQIKQIR